MPKSSETVDSPLFQKIAPQELGKSLSDNRVIFRLYGYFDVLNLIPKMIELFYSGEYGMLQDDLASDAMFNWLRTPEGMIEAGFGVFSLASISAFANNCYPSKIEADKAIYRTWQSLRDATKGIKNAIRGTKSTLVAVKLLSTQDLSYLLMPVGACLALLSAGNRLWSRGMINRRKDMMDENKSFITTFDAQGKINKLGDLDKWGAFEESRTLPADGSKALEKYAHNFLLIQNSSDNKVNGLYYIHYNYDTQSTTSQRLSLTTDQLADFHTKIGALKNTVHPTIPEWRALLPGIAEKHYRDFYQTITSRVQNNLQSAALQRSSYFSASYAGFIDGWYMFMGVITLTPLSSPALLAVTSISFLFATLCIATRIHEEKSFQQNLLVSQEKANLTLSAKTIETLIAELAEIQHQELEITQALSTDHQTSSFLPFKKFNTLPMLKNAYKEKHQELLAHFAHFSALRTKLHNTHKISQIDALLVGLRHALAAYTALVCSVFAVSSIALIFFATPLPQIVTLGTVATGVLLLISSTIYSLYQSAAYNTKKQALHDKNDTSIQAFVNSCQEKIARNTLAELKLGKTSDKFGFSHELMKLGLDLSLPIYALLCWTDIFRSFFSGSMKAFKFIFFCLALANTSEEYKESSLILWPIMIATSMLYALVWSGRALAKYHKELSNNATENATFMKKSTSDAAATDTLDAHNENTANTTADKSSDATKGLLSYGLFSNQIKMPSGEKAATPDTALIDLQASPRGRSESFAL